MNNSCRPHGIASCDRRGVNVRFEWLGLAVVALLASAWPTRVAAEALEPICADRPGLATGTCTVPAGMVQLEIGVFELRKDRTGGVRTDELAIGETSLKFGLSDQLHLEASMLPYGRTKVREADSTATVSGLGDLTIAAKYRFSAATDPLQLAIRPYVKVPTAAGALGNGTIEGGVVIPVEWELPGTPVSFTASPEFAILADEDGSGHHLSMAQALSIGMPLSSKLGFAIDVWGQLDWDPAGTSRQYAVGPSLSYLISNDVQIDAGADFGLNSQTSDLTIYSGISARF